MSAIAARSDSTAAPSADAPALPKALAFAPQVSNRIVFDGVTVAYRGTVVLEGLSLTVEPGEILALIGPSGSGKTTALRAVAGFIRPTAGRIHIGDADVTQMPPYARGIGMVVQNYALFPHMRVEANVAFGLLAQKAPRALIAERVGECLAMVGMTKFATRYPRELSGGQQQRVAIARALAIQPRVLLLDEPLSALDAQIRRSMVEELARLHRDLPNLTVLYVTHDQIEALTLADRIAIMRDGRLTALGPSTSLYRKPPNRFTAEFLGRANLLPVTIQAGDRDNGRILVRFGSRLLDLSDNPAFTAGDAALLCLRPHDVSIAASPIDDNTISGTIASVQWQGDSHLIAVSAEGMLIRMASAPLEEAPRPGSPVILSFNREAASLIPEDATVQPPTGRG
jgi:2-aminoethylphosphonate transport system ATP-binding protein